MAVLGRSVLLLSVLLVTGGCRSGPEQWGPFRGQVVDAETGVPLSGAHIMVSWERDNPNPVHWTQSFYDAQETVTDTNGRFEVPRKSRLLTALVSEPRFRAFAPGYRPETEDVTPIGGRPYVDATVLKMRPLKAREERCKYRPGGPSIDASQKVPIFKQAVQQYNVGLKCWELIEGQK